MKFCSKKNLSLISNSITRLSNAKNILIKQTKSLKLYLVYLKKFFTNIEISWHSICKNYLMLKNITINNLRNKAYLAYKLLEKVS